MFTPNFIHPLEGVLVIVKVRVSPFLRHYLPASLANLADHLDLSEGTTAGEVLKRLGLSEVYSSAILVNGRVPRKEEVLQEGDEIYLFPPLGGG